MEPCGREVHPRLAARMKHTAENEVIYSEIKPIRVWTLKEAALKQIGTGLRTPMNSVKIEVLNDSEFRVEFDNGKQAKICSFQHKDHWISICYHNNAVK
jgi:phosphopantetheinyl transferase